MNSGDEDTEEPPERPVPGVDSFDFRLYNEQLIEQRIQENLQDREEEENDGDRSLVPKYRKYLPAGSAAGVRKRTTADSQAQKRPTAKNQSKDFGRARESTTTQEVSIKLYQLLCQCNNSNK